jgi:hypothetical protein
VEDTIKRVQTAGNALEQKVNGMEETALIVRIDQNKKIEDLEAQNRE